VSASKTSSGRFELSRRLVLAALAAAAIGAGALLHTLPVAAQAKGPSEVPVEELMKPVGLPDLALGPADAKVTVVEYASMTCGHCAHFTKDVWPGFKKKYVDTNKVRYVFREFPLDNLAAAASMLARCTGGDKAFPLIEVLFEKQQEWAFGEGNPVPRLFEIAKQAGFTQESFDKCLTDQKLLDDITAGRSRASDVFGVSATPTFYVNGKKLDGQPTLEKLDQMIEPLLAKS
jgi:protein-disulfide isomerase